MISLLTWFSKAQSRKSGVPAMPRSVKSRIRPTVKREYDYDDPVSLKEHRELVALEEAAKRRRDGNYQSDREPEIQVHKAHFEDRLDRFQENWRRNRETNLVSSLFVPASMPLLYFMGLSPMAILLGSITISFVVALVYPRLRGRTECSPTTLDPRHHGSSRRARG
jgi:hypothetical protein